MPHMYRNASEPSKLSGRLARFQIGTNPAFIRHPFVLLSYQFLIAKIASTGSDTSATKQRHRADNVQRSRKNVQATGTCWTCLSDMNIAVSSKRSMQEMNENLVDVQRLILLDENSKPTIKRWRLALASF